MRESMQITRAGAQVNVKRASVLPANGLCVSVPDGEMLSIAFSNKTSMLAIGPAEFKIEASIGTQALSTVETLRFTREEFYRMFQENRTLTARCFENFSMYINLLCYETAHQEYNNSFIKVCNLLYLFSLNSPSGKSTRIELTQQVNLIIICRKNFFNQNCFQFFLEHTEQSCYIISEKGTTAHKGLTS